MKKDLVNTFKFASLVTFALCLLLSSVVNAAEPTTKTDTGLVDRATQRKNTLKLQLSNEQSQKIMKNCSAAQNVLKNVLTKDKALADKRQEIYSDLSTKLTTTTRKLNSQNVDITELKSAQIQLDAAMNKYLEDIATYKTTLDDMTKLECSADPVGFEATLVTARQLRVMLADDSKQVKIAKNTMVQALAKVSAVLSASKGSNQ